MRPRALVLLLAAAAAVGLTTAPASASEPLPPDTVTGKPGIHALLDGQENRSVTCAYGGVGNDLTLIRIAPPIVFARNRTSGPDAAVVAWRWDVLRDAGGGYAVVESGPLVKRTATDRRAADFRRAVVAIVPTPLSTYRVRYRLIWYKPGSTTKQVASVVTWASRYRTSTGDLPPSIDVCYASAPPTVLPETPTDHFDDYGIHAIVDNETTPGLRCTNRGAGLALTRIGIMPAVAFMADRTGGKDAGTVTRRIVLQSTNVIVAGSWTDRKVLGVEKRSATDRRMASFPARVIKLGTTGPSHPGWRIVVRFRFLTPGGKELGRVLEEPLFGWQDDGSPAVSGFGLCFGHAS